MATRRPWAIHIASIIALALFYVAAAQLGYSIGAVTPHTLLLWAPSGIGLGAVIIFGSSIAPGIAIGAFMSAFLWGHSLEAALLIGVVDMFEAIAAAYVLRELLDFHPALDRVRDVIALVGTALVMTFFDAALISLGLVLLGWMPGSMLATLSERWWWSHLGGDLIVTPLVITALTRGNRDPARERPIERVLLMIAVLVVAASIFYPGFPDVLPGTPRAYQIFPLLLWAGVRFGPRGAALTSFVVGVMAIVGTALGTQELIHIANLQSFVSISSVTTLVLAALHAERVAVARRKSAIQEAVLDGILTLDRDGHILEFNPAAEHMFGVGAPAVIGKDIARLLVPGQRSTPVTASAAGQRLRLRAVRADGNTFPAEIALTRVDLEDHDLFTAVVRDCTLEETNALALRESRDRLEDKVRERTAALVRSETMLKTSQRLAHIGSFEVYVGQLSCSDETLRIFGRDPDTFKATTADFYGAISDDDERTLVRDRIELARKTGGAFEIDTRIVRPDGTMRVLHITAVALEGRVAGCCQDITERYQAQEVKQRLIGIVESTDDAIIGLSLDAKIVSWNAAAARIFGYRPEQILGRDVAVLVAGDGATSVNERIVAIRAGQHLSHYELDHRRADGSFFAASVTMSVVRDLQGKPMGFSKVLRDISRQKVLEATTLASLREKEVLLREVHHRVKNNLQVISSLLTMQVERVPEVEARRALIDSQNRIQSMALVHQQLYQSKDLARIDLLDYIEILVGRIATTNGIRPEKIATEVRGAQVFVDIDRAIPCGLIVNELVTNAMTHGFPDGRSGKVIVELSYTPAGARIAVCDDGVGIAGGIQIDELKTFGLKIAEILTRQLAGTLTFASTNGTCVSLAFPLVPGN